MKRTVVLCLTALLAFSSTGFAGLRVEQEKATTIRSVQGTSSSFLGVELAEVNRNTVDRLKLHEERGALIEGVTDGSSAAQAGLKKDDVIIKWDGDKIESARELSRLIRETPAGRNVRLGVIRDGHEINVDVKLGERVRAAVRPRIVGTTPVARAEIRAEAARVREQFSRSAEAFREAQRAASAQMRERVREASARARESVRSIGVQSFGTGRLGVQLQSMTPQLAEYFGLSKRTGSLIVFVYADSPAAKAGLKAGDVILSAGSRSVENPMDIRSVLREKVEGPLELKIMRDKQEQTVTVQVEKRTGSLLLAGDECGDLIHAAIAPIQITVPQVAVAPIHLAVPAVTLAPVTIPSINVSPVVSPQIGTTPMAIPQVKIAVPPVKVTVPNVKIAPVNIIISPRRITV